jgi:hypothetical protein
MLDLQVAYELRQFQFLSRLWLAEFLPSCICTIEIGTGMLPILKLVGSKVA